MVARAELAEMGVQERACAEGEMEEMGEMGEMGEMVEMVEI